MPNDKGSVSGWQVARLALLGITLVIIALGVRLAVGSHPLSVTFLRWSDTPVFPANVPDEFRSRFPKGEYALLGVTNNGSRSLRFNSRAVEYDSDGRWIKVIPKQWLGMDGYWWDGGGLGSIVWLTQPSEVPRGVRWRIRYVCALDVSRDANAALRRTLNQIAGKVLGTNTLAFCAPVEMVSPEIPPANVQDGATNGRQPLRSETGRQPTPTISFAGIEPGRTYRAAGFYVTNCTHHAILMRRVQVEAADDGNWKTVSENNPDASRILEPGSSSFTLSPVLEAGEHRKIVVEWPEEPPWRVCLFYGQEQKGVKALMAKARLAWVAHPKEIWQVAYWRTRVWGGAGQVTSREVTK